MASKKIAYYFKNSDVHGIVYSVDKVTVKFRLIAKYFGKFLAFIRKHSNCHEREQETKRMHYRYFFELKYSESVMVIEFSLNGIKDMDGKIIMNPNKCFDDTDCITDLICIRTLCCMFTLSSIDLAMDIPEEKSLVHMAGVRRKVSYYTGRKQDCKLTRAQKEARKDLCDDMANYITEYHGTKGHKTIDGYCRLYFKTFECGLDYDVTRFEMTLVTSGKKNDTVAKVIDKFFRFMPKLFITRETDFSKYKDDKFYKKHAETFEILNRVHNPYRVLREELEVDSDSKKLYSAYEQKQFLERLDLQYIEPQRGAIEELLDGYYSIMEKLLSYTYEDVVDKFADIPADTDDAIEEVMPHIDGFDKNTPRKERNTVNDW
ncbi:MAG: hypothetical protein K6G19_08225 [Lachnospiraceae bacterium]|nr:hypothetical protein [Lachnospiraceae bacterium]